MTPRAPSGKRLKYRAVVFDIDGTITTHVSSWRYIHERLGKWDALACRYQAQFLAGEISYRRFCALDAAHWRGLPEKEVSALFEDVEYARNAPECLRRFKEMGFLLVALSTGLQFLPERLVADFGFDHAISNRLVSNGGRLTGEVEIRVPHGGKGRALERLLGALGLPAREVIGVGDSVGDIPLVEACGYSIAFNSSSPELSARVDHDCPGDDFREVFRAVASAAGFLPEPENLQGARKKR